MSHGRTALALALVTTFAFGCDSEPDPSVDAGISESDAGPTSPLDAGFEVASAPTLPSVTGACPDFSATGRITVSPSGTSARELQLWISDAAQTLDGPLVFYWHGTGSRPEEALYGLGQDTVDAILALGGMVIAPTRAPDSGDFPWHLTTGSREDDLLVADEALACAIEAVGVDVTRIHAIGMSAGGLHTTQMSFRRASYLASVVTYSGGMFLPRRPPTDEPTNRFAALIFHGGPSDVVIIGFQEASERYWQALTDTGHTGVLCDHGGGHSIPTDARGSVWAFFQAHPYGTHPSPYAAGLPSSLPSYCGLMP